MKKRIKQVAKWVIGLLAMLLAWLWIGGLDCEAPEDGDLLVSWSDKKVALKDNAYCAMSKLCEMCEDKLENNDFEFLQFYLFPVERECDYIADSYWIFTPGNDFTKLVYDFGKRVKSLRRRVRETTLELSELFLGKDFYEVFMDDNELAKEIERIIAKYKDVLDSYDRIAAEGDFAPLSGKERDDVWGKERAVWVLNGMESADSIRPLLFARIKHAVRLGDFVKAAELFKNDVSLGRKICDNASNLRNFARGAEMICNSVGNISRLVNEYDFPESVLLEMNRIMDGVSNFGKQSVVNALKREYSTVRYWVLHEWDSYERRRKRDVDSLEEWVYGIASDLFYRYSFHPNRTLSKWSEITRRRIAEINDGKCMTDCDPEWYATKNKWLKWCGLRHLLPNSGVEYDLMPSWFYNTFQKPLVMMLAVRLQIAMKLHAAKFGKPAKTVLEMKEFLGDVPDRILGTAVSIDLDALKVSCGDSSVPIDVEKWPHTFPLIYRDGKIFTNDGKNLVWMDL